MPDASSAGASVAPPMPGPVPMPWNRPSTSAVRQRGLASRIPPTGVPDILRHATPSASHEQASRPRSLRGFRGPTGATVPFAVGDPRDTALAETVDGPSEAEAMRRRGPRRSFDAVEYAALEWVHRFDERRLPEPTGNIPPAEAEATFQAAMERADMDA